MESISVFEIIKVGIGPSSSHTMGPWNAASAFIRIIKRERSIDEVKEVFLEFFGSLAKTGIGHGTDIAGMLGLNGEDFKTINTSKIDEKIEEIKNTQILNLGGEKEIPFIFINIFGVSINYFQICIINSLLKKAKTVQIIQHISGAGTL